MPDELILIRGDTADIAVSGLLDDQGNPTVFGNGDILIWTAKERLDAFDVLLTKTSADGGIDIQVGTDTATVHIVPADWTDIVLPADLDFVWDLQITVGGDPTQISTLDSGPGTIRADVTGNVVTGPAALGGVTCTPWATPTDVLPSCISAVLDPADLEIALQISSDILYEFTGRRYKGVCSDRIRPLARWRDLGTPGWWPTWEGRSPRWGWCSCNRSPDFGCTSLPAIRLPGYPVVPSSVEVTVDGVAFTDFVVLDRRTLVRTDGEGWPCCQDLTLDPTEEGTWQVAYSYGVGPPLGGKRAAALLGCELYRSFHPESGDCALPQRVTNIVRQGVSMAILDPLTLFSDGRTGLPFVDLWVASVLRGDRAQVSLIVPGRGRSATRIG